jgi:formylglycine-generating enzyme required for sulfatase activity
LAALLGKAPIASPGADRPPEKLQRRPGEPLVIQLNDKVTMHFVWCPPGTFLMGSPPGEAGRHDDEVQHRVTLTKGFYLAEVPMTQEQWQAVMGSNPSKFMGDHRPVESVTWDECQDFCRKLSARNGKRYRLPTEAEWEYACRAGTTMAYCGGDGPGALKKVGWCSHDGTYGSARETKAVGGLLPNAWGLYDMHGNVWEWCADWYTAYPPNDVTDPQGGRYGDARVLRGGCWFNVPRDCRSAYRLSDAPGNRDDTSGCRVVLCLD